MFEEVSLVEDAVFLVLLVVSTIFFFQEYFYFIDPNHEPIWIVGIPLTIIGIIGLVIFTVWYILRGKDQLSTKSQKED